MFRDRKILAFSVPKECAYNTPSFRKLWKMLGKIPHDFSILKKRVIAITACENMHYVTYLVFNLGAHLQEGDAGKMPNFIVDCDSMSHGLAIKSMLQFVSWILLVIHELEILIANFQLIPAGGVIVNPMLADIGQNTLIQLNAHRGKMCEIPMTDVPSIPQQVDMWNCGVFTVLNKRACSLADIHQHVLWRR